jgi:hypothetical protein
MTWRPSEPRVQGLSERGPKQADVTADSGAHVFAAERRLCSCHCQYNTEMHPWRMPVCRGRVVRAV